MLAPHTQLKWLENATKYIDSNISIIICSIQSFRYCKTVTAMIFSYWQRIVLSVFFSFSLSLPACLQLVGFLEIWFHFISISICIIDRCTSKDRHHSEKRRNEMLDLIEIYRLHENCMLNWKSTWIDGTSERFFWSLTSETSNQFVSHPNKMKHST